MKIIRILKILLFAKKVSPTSGVIMWAMVANTSPVIMISVPLLVVAGGNFKNFFDIYCSRVTGVNDKNKTISLLSSIVAK